MFKFITEGNCRNHMSRERQCLSGTDYDRFSALSPEQKSNLLLLLLEVLTRHTTSSWIKLKSALLYILVDFKDRGDVAVIAKKVRQEPKQDAVKLEAKMESHRKDHELLTEMAQLAIPEDFPHDRAMYWLRGFYLRLLETQRGDPSAFVFSREVDFLVRTRDEKKRIEGIIAEVVRPSSIIKKPKTTTKK